MSSEAPVQHKPEIRYASEGSGPLVERDYRAIFRGVDRTPEEVAEVVRARFPDFAPSETAVFRRCEDQCPPLVVGDVMEIKITLLGLCRVRVVHSDSRSVTLRTLEGHPEAGRITFGAYLEGDKLAFRILSRTRQASFLKYLGYLVLGKQLQSRCWIGFLWKLAETLGGTLEGPVRVSTKAVKDRPSDWGATDTPTFYCAEEY